MSLPAEAKHAPTARHFVRTYTTYWGLAEEDRDRAELIVSELAGNAARHGLSDMTVCLSVDDRELRIDVTDTGRRKSACSRTTTPPTPPDESGRGLALVTLVADWSHTQRTRDGWRTCAGLTVLP